MRRRARAKARCRRCGPQEFSEGVMQTLNLLRLLALTHAPRVIGAAAAKDLRYNCTCKST